MDQAQIDKRLEDCDRIVAAIQGALSAFAQAEPEVLEDSTIISAFGIVTADMLKYLKRDDPRAAISLFGSIVTLHFNPADAHEAPEGKQ